MYDHQILHLLWETRSFHCLLPLSRKRAVPPVKRDILMRISSLFPTSHLTLSTIIQVNQTRQPIEVLVDSGTEQNLISQDLANELSIPIQTLQLPLSVVGITGHTLDQI